MKKSKRTNGVFDKNLSPLENLNRQRQHQEMLDHRRYIIQKIFGIIRTIGLIALGIWGYATRDTIHAFIVNFFTNPKLGL